MCTFLVGRRRERGRCCILPCLASPRLVPSRELRSSRLIHDQSSFSFTRVVRGQLPTSPSSSRPHRLLCVPRSQQHTRLVPAFTKESVNGPRRNTRIARYFGEARRGEARREKERGTFPWREVKPRSTKVCAGMQRVGAIARPPTEKVYFCIRVGTWANERCDQL